MKLPTLYKKSSTGAMMQWDIQVDDDMAKSVITTKHGQIGGAIQTSTDTVSEGKNIGQKNETSHFQQAAKEAQAKWKLQKTKKGYVETIEAAEAGEVDALVTGGYFPMLAAKYKDKVKKIDWSKGPHYVQPKLDGYRTPSTVVDGKATLWSRTRKPTSHVAPLIVEQIGYLTGNQNARLDGEGYVHEWVEKYGKDEAFEMLGTWFRAKKLVEGHEQIKLHLYDFPSAGGTFKERYALLKKLFELADPAKIPNLVLVETTEATCQADVDAAEEKYLAQGYEGAIFRTSQGEYLEHPTNRSNDLLKIKVFQDEEFPIVAITEGRGKMAGKAIFTCRAQNGETFDAKKDGKLEALKEYFLNPDKYIGKQLTVRYFGLTSARKVPRHPVAKAIREPE